MSDAQKIERSRCPECCQLPGDSGTYTQAVLDSAATTEAQRYHEAAFPESTKAHKKSIHPDATNLNTREPPKVVKEIKNVDMRRAAMLSATKMSKSRQEALKIAFPLGVESGGGNTMQQQTSSQLLSQRSDMDNQQPPVLSAQEVLEQLALAEALQSQSFIPVPNPEQQGEHTNMQKATQPEAFVSNPTFLETTLMPQEDYQGQSASMSGFGQQVSAPAQMEQWNYVDPNIHMPLLPGYFPYEDFASISVPPHNYPQQAFSDQIFSGPSFTDSTLPEQSYTDQFPELNFPSSVESDASFACLPQQATFTQGMTDPSLPYQYSSDFSSHSSELFPGMTTKQHDTWETASARQYAGSQDYQETLSPSEEIAEPSKTKRGLDRPELPQGKRLKVKGRANYNARPSVM